MCGLTGLWDVRHGLGGEAVSAALRDMTAMLACRGPDDEGHYQDAEAGVGFGHRRLSIFDLTAEGHQPMTSPSGRYVIIYNGEIYNFVDLRDILVELGCSFRGQSDTEVLLAAIEQWGLAQALERANGMFALALWDRQTQKLSLARDRLGIKPLYYGWSGGVLLFGSELKALRAAPGFDSAVSRDALTLFLRQSNVPAPYSIYDNIYKLQPGTILTLDAAFAAQPRSLVDQKPRTTTFWSARHALEQGAAERFAGSPEAAVAQLDTLLRDAVGIRMAADVPLGAFLSGGIDSSTVVALMQAQSSCKVRTFSIGFNEAGYDEARHAKAVAEHLGAEHTELYVTSADAMDVIPQLPAMYDEPFADFSQIPTYLVSQLARREVTVSLSGDGGDELFCGYHRYFWSRRIWGRIGAVSPPMRGRIAAFLRRWPGLWANALRAGLRIMPARYQVDHPRQKVELLASIMGLESADALYTHLISHWQHPERAVPGGHVLPTVDTAIGDRIRLDDYIERMMYFDMVNYLPNDILTKVDRATMAVGLEARVPLLDHRLVEFAARLPLAWKMRHPQGKWPLRQVLEKYVPRSLVERPKQGFSVPVEQWMKGPLRDWVESLLDEQRLRREGLLDVSVVRDMWQRFLADPYHGGKREIWDVLMFEGWIEGQG